MAPTLVALIYENWIKKWHSILAGTNDFQGPVNRVDVLLLYDGLLLCNSHLMLVVGSTCLLVWNGVIRRESLPMGLLCNNGVLYLRVVRRASLLCLAWRRSAGVDCWPGEVLLSALVVRDKTAAAISSRLLVTPYPLSPSTISSTVATLP